MSVEDVAAAHYGSQRAITTLVVRGVTAEWANVDPAALDASFVPVLNRIIPIVIAGQLGAAGQADAYTNSVLKEQNVDAPAEGRIEPRGFAGAAADGRSLGTLLQEPVIAAKVASAAGGSLAEVSAAGLASLVRIVGTEIPDAGRLADGVAIAARPHVTGFVRMTTPPSCSRCAILAGRWYKWNSGFLRHPRCDCRHIPASEDVAGDLRTDPMALLRKGQITDLSKADTRAVLESGADLNQVVNARRGMYSAGGRKFTTANVNGRQRLRPEQIYRDASDRADAVRLLRSHGYIH